MSKFNIIAKPSFDKVGKAISQIAEGLKLQDEIEKFAFSIEGEAKKVTPVDTGRLRASIKTKIKPLGAIIQPNTDYAVFVHEGHRTRGGGNYVRGRPFMTTGFEVAKLKRYGMGVPFAIHVQKVIDDQIKALN